MDKYNQKNPDKAMKLRGFLIGNGVMDFTDGSLYYSEIEYLINHDFVDPDILNYWKQSCQTDPESAGCAFFTKKFEENIFELNPYNVYDYCYYNDSFNATENKQRRVYHTQESILRDLVMKERKGLEKAKFNGAPCAYFDGVYDYFNKNEENYHAAFTGMVWNGPCVILELFRRRMFRTTMT